MLVGLEAPDDAAVYRVAPDLALVQTVDFFTPIVDDAFAWGRIAAANALSDVYAMGGRPVTALNLIGWPRALGFDLLGAVLDGAGEACDEAGVTVVGGHSVDDPEPKYGMAVTGTVHPDRVVRKTGGRAGCALILTKPIGTGIVSNGIKEGKTTRATVADATANMSKLNAAAADAMTEVGVAAATDVTGYGLIGHLLQMLDETSSALLRFGDIPMYAEALELQEAGVVPGGTKRNHEALKDRVDFDAGPTAGEILLFDAQTSGGLLMAVEPDRREALRSALEARGVLAAQIGELVPGNGRIRVVA